jgi:hypothetical protein
MSLGIFGGLEDSIRRFDRECEAGAIEGERKFPDGRMGVRLSRKHLSARKVA